MGRSQFGFFLALLCSWAIAIALPSSSADDFSTVFAFDSILDIIQRISVAKNWKPDLVNILNIDFEDARFKKTEIYYLDLQIGERIFPTKFIDEIEAWQRLGDLETCCSDLDHQRRAAKDLWNSEVFGSVLPPFGVYGPLDLLFESTQTTQDERDIGNLEKLTLGDGNSVIVEGAQEVSLTHSVELQLSMNKSSPIDSLVAGILSVAAKTRHASENEEVPKLSLRIMGPALVTSITGVDFTSETTGIEQHDSDVLKLLFKAEGQYAGQSNSMASQKSFDKASMWPFFFLNSSDAKLLMLDEILKVYLDSKVYKPPFIILDAKVAATTFVLFEFDVERKLTEENFDLELWPEWKTKPTFERCRFQVLAKVQEMTLKPLVVRHLKQYTNVETHTWRDYTSNASYTSFPSFLVPSSPMTIDVD